MLLVGQDDLDGILAHARRDAPAEACGVLGGRDDGDIRRVTGAWPCRNVAGVPAWEYRAHPQDQLAAFLAIEDAGLEVVGIYHSHPRGPPRPSDVDAARASYPGLTHLIAWLEPTEGWGAWRWLAEGGFVAERWAFGE